MNTQGIFRPALSGEPPPRTPPRTPPPLPQQQQQRPPPGRGPGGPGGSGGRGDAVHRGPPHGQPPPPWPCEPAAAWSPPSQAHRARPGVLAEPAAGGATRRSSEQCDEQVQDGVRKMLEAPRRKELPPLPPLPSTPLRRRILVRPKPDIPTYFRLCSSGSGAADAPHPAVSPAAATADVPMDRFNKFRFGGREDRERERERQGAAAAAATAAAKAGHGPAHAASGASRTARTSDKTERLRELTERLKGGSAPPTPAPTPSPSPTPTPAQGPQGPQGAEGPPSPAAGQPAVGPAGPAGPADGPAKEDDLFDLRLARPESRAIVGSYIQRTIPFRSASFSQVDFSDGKYFRHPTARAAAAWLKPLTAATLPRKKTAPSDDLSPASSIAAVDQPSGSTPSLGAESAVDSAVGSDEGCLGSMGSVGPVGPPRLPAKPPGSRSMTHPLSSRAGSSGRGSRDHGDGAFPPGNGLAGEDADEASRPDSGAMLSVAADPRLTNSCSSLSDAEAAAACPEAADAPEAPEVAEAAEAAEAPRADVVAQPQPETPPCDGGPSPTDADIRPLDNPVSYEVFVRQFPNYKEYEKWMNESVLVNNNSDSNAEWQANLNNSINNHNHNNNNNMEADSDERKVSEAIKGLNVPAVLEHDDRCINNFDPSTCPKCLEQMETGPSILQKLKASFHMEDMELEPHEKELYSRHTDILLRKWTAAPAAPKPKHPFERSKSEPKETSKEDKPKLLAEPAAFQRTKSTDEAEAALEPPQISLPVEEKGVPEPRTASTASAADSDELKRRRPKDEPRRWLERPKLICQSSDERDEESSAGSASLPVRPRFPMLGRSDSLSEGESDQGDRRPSTPSRASPSLYSHLDLSDSEGRAGCVGCAPPSAASSARSPHTPRRYSKRPLRGPYGQMLEAEMKKPEANRKLSQYTEDLKFLEEFSSKTTGSSQSLGVAAAFPAAPSAELTRSVSSAERGAAPRARHQGNLSMDDSQLRAAAQADRLDPTHPAARPADRGDRAPKRKVSAADLSSLHPGGSGMAAAAGSSLPVCHQRTTSSPSQLEGIATRHHATVDADLFRRQTNAAPPRHDAEDPAKRTWKDTRTHVVVELYETERNYVEALDFLVKEYMQPLKRSENAGMVDSELVEQIFYQVPAILCHHREFLEDLQKRLENWDFHQKVGDVLLNAFTKRSVIDTYTAFINNWNTAKEAIKSTCQAKPAFARYLEAMSREHKGRLALDSLLIKPVQRIPRYELLIGRLLKHTDPSHADHSQLLDAQREIHELAVKINCTERESLEAEQQQQTLRDLEALVDGCDLVSQGRVFLRHDMVTLASNTGQGGGTRKERVLFLFSDLVVIARTKRNIRKPSAAGSSTSVASGLEGNRYRCSMKATLDDLEIVKAKDESLRRVMREMEQLSEDVAALTQITELASSLHLPHAPQQPPPQQQQQQQQQLEELARDLLSSACRQLAERQNSDSQLSCLDLTVNTSNGVENITVIFTKPDKRSSWEETFNEAKTRLALSADRRPSPKFKTSVPIRKTRAGLQFTCAAPTLAGPGCAGAAPAAAPAPPPGVSPGAAAGLRDVWVCNSDGYVGQVCVLSLVPEPNVTSCNGVCNARILCVAAIPATPPPPAPSSSSQSVSCPSQLTNSKAGISISVEDTDKAARNLHLDSSSSSDEFDDDNDSGSAPEERLRSNTADSQASAPGLGGLGAAPAPTASHGAGVAPSNGNADAPPPPAPGAAAAAPGGGAAGTAPSSGATASSAASSGPADDGLAQPTMWLGTEDGCIHVYSCNDNIRIKRNKVKIQHGAAVHCIMYFDNRVFVSLANGDITVYSRDQAGGWSTSEPYTVTVGSAACPVTRMVPIAGRLWCSCQHTIKVLNTHTLQVEQTVVAADSNRSVTCFVVSGLAVWLSVQNSAVLKLYHASTFEHLGEVNVAPAVTKMLASCDDIIRQHKAACLRVTSLLACKDLLWIGTSAGVILTMPLPHVAPGTARLTSSPNVSGVPHGHTGHVRFLTVVDAVPGAPGPGSGAPPQPHRHSWKHKGDQAGPGNANKLLVISGGDGYEDFRTSSVSEVAGKEDSTNHLLMWQV